MSNISDKKEDQDFILIKEFTSGSDEAFNKLVLKYHKKIYWHARRMLGNHMDADEVTQEVLIVMFEKLKSFNFNSTLFTWIYQITSRRALNYIRKRSVKSFLYIDDSDKEMIVDSDNLIENFEDKEKIKKLDKVLNKLPPKQREIFIFRHFENLSYDEISEITGKSVGGLKASYFHAIKKVTELMENE